MLKRKGAGEGGGEKLTIIHASPPIHDGSKRDNVVSSTNVIQHEHCEEGVQKVCVWSRFFWHVLGLDSVKYSRTVDDESRMGEEKDEA